MAICCSAKAAKRSGLTQALGRMKDFLAVVFALSAIAVLPAFLASIFSTHKLNLYLRTAHPEVWAGISPKPRTEPSLSSPNARYITQRSYRQVNDLTLQQLGDRAYRLLYFAATVFLILVLSGLAIAE